MTRTRQRPSHLDHSPASGAVTLGIPRHQRGSRCVRFATDHPYVLTASCPSRMGTTAAVTGFLASRRFYLIEMHQFDDTLSQRFFVRITFCAVQGEKVDLRLLREEFAPVAQREEMEWRIHDSRERTRVLIMVSNFDHCLEDLLYRHRMGELEMDVS